MKSPVDYGVLILDEAGSTQDVAAEAIHAGDPVGVVVARLQFNGRGRFRRRWHAERDNSLAASFCFLEEVDHPKPYLLGMAMAVAVAEAFDLKIAWPNDLRLNGKKVGGILSELVSGPMNERIPVVGVGLNLKQSSFPAEIADRATSLLLEGRDGCDPEAAYIAIGEALANLPSPTAWSAIAERWAPRDETPGKLYRLNDGTEIVARGIGADGQLLATQDGELMSVYAADAILPL